MGQGVAITTHLTDLNAKCFYTMRLVKSTHLAVGNSSFKLYHGCIRFSQEEAEVVVEWERKREEVLETQRERERERKKWISLWITTTLTDRRMHVVHVCSPVGFSPFRKPTRSWAYIANLLAQHLLLGWTNCSSFDQKIEVQCELIRPQKKKRMSGKFMVFQFSPRLAHTIIFH